MTGRADLSHTFSSFSCVVDLPNRAEECQIGGTAERITILETGYLLDETYLILL